METFSTFLTLCAGNSPTPVNTAHKGQWRGTLLLSLICAWINDWVNNREAGDLRRHRAHYDVIVIILVISTTPCSAIDENFIKMIFPFQWWNHYVIMTQCVRWVAAHLASLSFYEPSDSRALSQSSVCRSCCNHLDTFASLSLRHLTLAWIFSSACRKERRPVPPVARSSTMARTCWKTNAVYAQALIKTRISLSPAKISGMFKWHISISMWTCPVAIYLPLS